MYSTTDRRGQDGLTKSERATLRAPGLWDIEQMTERQFIARHVTGEEMVLIAFRDGSFSVTSNTGHLHSVDHMLGCDCEDANYRQPTPCGSCKHAAVAQSVERFLDAQEKERREVDEQAERTAKARAEIAAMFA